MKSGLEDRNNPVGIRRLRIVVVRLNEVRPGRPEQYFLAGKSIHRKKSVSMKSGLEDRNNERTCAHL